MTTQVISCRLPSSVDAALRSSAANAHMSVSGAVDWLLQNSFEHSQLLQQLVACPAPWSSKLDVRILDRTFEQLKLASEKLGTSTSVYTRKLLYHFYITRRVQCVKADDRYTLAFRHD